MDEQAIAALVGEVEQAWNTHDMRRLAACFVNVRGWWWRGRWEIERNHALFHETIFRTRATVRLGAVSSPASTLARMAWSSSAEPRRVYATISLI